MFKRIINNYSVAVTALLTMSFLIGFSTRVITEPESRLRTLILAPDKRGVTQLIIGTYADVNDDSIKIASDSQIIVYRHIPKTLRNGK